MKLDRMPFSYHPPSKPLTLESYYPGNIHSGPRKRMHIFVGGSLSGGISAVWYNNRSVLCWYPFLIAVTMQLLLFQAVFVPAWPVTVHVFVWLVYI